MIKGEGWVGTAATGSRLGWFCCQRVKAELVLMTEGEGLVGSAASG